MKQKRNYLQIFTLIALAMVFSMPAHAGLDTAINGASSFVVSLMKLLNLCLGFLGAWFAGSGIMNWKKSSSEQGGHQMGFKEIVVPVIAGIILLGFSSFIAMTSSTFGFVSTTASNLG
ncbi:hypothetical protein GALL_118140 [mine drainage metagenome]|jgi:hypothetical protein|uniref:Uncharacterized protein n=1 Tax=mine drainage metagenome TaxID=410659 RepID=A0A1J5SBY5_9ZZZZ